MTALLRAELRRITSRRLVRILVIATLVLAVVLLARVFSVSHRDSPEERQRAIAEQIEDYRRQCERARQEGHISPDASCDLIGEGEIYYEDPRLIASDALPGVTTAAAVAVGMLAFVIGASYVGAEWHAGTMQALLFWEPRRGRVLAAKAAALVLTMMAFSLLLTAVVYLGAWFIAATRGSTEGVTTGLHLSNLLTMLRGFVFVAFTSLTGFALAGLGRITGAALGVGFAYFAIVENIVRAVRPRWQAYYLFENFTALLNKRLELIASSGGPGGFQQTTQVLTSTRAAITLGVYVTLLLGAFYLWFTRRDVT